jgi:hypothetical protein
MVHRISFASLLLSNFCKVNLTSIY